MKRRASLLLVLLVGGFLAVGCSGVSVLSGIPNRWRTSRAGFVVGKTTADDVLGVLGPPSQLVSLSSGAVYYYVLEEKTTWTFSLILFDHSSTDIRYDRAIFYFDRSDQLTRYALSPTVIEGGAE